MRIAYDNLVDSALSLTALSSVTGYSILNVQDQRLSMPWKSSTATTQTVLVETPTTATSYMNVNTAAILGHNILTGTTVRIEGNDTDSWASPSVSETFTINSDIILKFFTGGEYKYWRFYFQGQGSLQIGRLWLGEYLSIDPSSLLDFKVIEKNSDRKIYGKDRQKFAIEGVYWRRFELTFPETAYTMIEDIEDMYDTVGNFKSVIFCNFDTIREYKIVEPCYCSIDGEIGFDHTERMRFKYQLALEEDK